MDGDTESSSPSESPRVHLPKPAGSGLTLVIPSLKSLKASQSTAKKPKPAPVSDSQPNAVFQDIDSQEKKISRPVKLKPLKEVLIKLIAQIKKKDDYAFFLAPVVLAKVPGYSDVIKHPMDFGTMTVKVNRGKYRSLDEFASDFKLVTNNAKTFNPLGSIYYSEAERIETWGLDHINKAASTVIQFETDWTIDVEQDDEEQPVNVDQDEDRDTPMDVDGSTLDERSQSIAPSQPPQGYTRRGPRGPYKREKNVSSNTISETLEPDGGLPGSKDGIGAFPPGSDWTKTMLVLKLKGKRYKTKKERMRIERDGPPLLPDGSLDYTEMEDPFSFLSALVPDQPSRPQLLPLYPPLYQPPLPLQPTDPPSTQASTPQPQHPPPLASASRVPHIHSATAIPPSHALPSLPFLQTAQAQTTVNGSQPSKRRHWVINRNVAARQKGKEKEDDQQDFPDTPAWQTPHEPCATDFGSFSILAGALAEEMVKRGITSSTVAAVMEAKESLDEEVNLELIRNSLDLEVKMRDLEGGDANGTSKGGVPQELNATNLLTNGYWTNRRAAEAEEYVWDVVYGGVEGFAYVRSLAEFVDGHYLKEDLDSNTLSNNEGIALQQWVIENIVDPLTEGRHSLLREAALELIRQRDRKAPNMAGDPRKGTVASQVVASLHLYPTTLVALSSLLHIRLHKIDMGSLLKTPEELFISEEEWAGKSIKVRRKRKSSRVKQEDDDGDAAERLFRDENNGATVVGTGSNGEHNAMEVEEPEQSWASVDADLSKEGKGQRNGKVSDYELEGPEELNEVLEYVAGVIVELDKKTRAKKGPSETATSSANGTSDKPDGDEKPSSANPNEDPVLRNLRLNLLALAKRAPLDTIARLPKDLVPAHIRHFVPTLGSSG